MAKKITKDINSKFNPTLMNSYNMYGFGSWVKDAGLLYADTMMSSFGGKDAITDGDYSNKGMAKASQIISPIYEQGAKVAANVLAPGIGGAALGSVQQGVGSAIGKDTSVQNGGLLSQQNLISNLPGQSNYTPTFGMGGDMNMMGGNKEILDRVSSIDSNTTHEQSPFGGVPVGQRALLEKDEYLYTNKSGKKYVFTNKF